MGQFRRRPEVVEAMRVGDGLAGRIALAEWINRGGRHAAHAVEWGAPWLLIATRDGRLLAPELGDWVVLTDDGLLTVMTHDRFAASYEQIGGRT